MAFFNKLNQDIDIDKHIQDEKNASQEIKRIIETSLEDFKKLNKLEKTLEKGNNQIMSSAEKRKRVETKYDVRISRAQNPDKKRRLKFRKYAKLAALSKKAYKKLQKKLIKLQSLPETEKHFEEVNARIDHELKNLLSGIRGEYKKEREEERSA